MSFQSYVKQYNHHKVYINIVDLKYICAQIYVTMKSDIEIARSIELVKIKELASQFGIDKEHVTHYGRHMAKVDYSVIDEEKVKNGNLILVTAITPTKAGIGKTTVSVGLALGMNKIGKKAILALREPSL